MIPNQWYAILESNEVKKGKPVGVARMGVKLVAWRDAAGQVSVLSDLCPHRGVALSAGEVKGDCIICPFHGFRFDTSGRCTLVPANGRAAPVPKALQVRSYATCEMHDFIFIYWGETTETPAPPQWFDDLDDSFSYSSAKDPWHAHYSRIIENQLDVPHVPFVHRNTIGRGERTVIDGPWVCWKGPSRFWVVPQMRREDGTRALRAEDAPPPEKNFHLDFIFPNLWQNYIGDSMRIVIAFVPVDGENSLLYVRSYQKFVRTPVLRTVVNKLAMPTNLFVAHQDRRVVETQRPFRSELRMGEKLIPGDGPIIAYRRRRQELIDAAN